MLAMILPRELKALGGIAVAAAEQAGVIHADISAYGTSAFLALGWVFFRGSVVFEERSDQIVVYAFSRQDIQFGHIEHFIRTGRAPHYTELAATLGVLPEAGRLAQHKAAESSLACWFVKDTDYVESWAPFSNVPTPYLVSVEGEQKWYGQ